MKKITLRTSLCLFSLIIVLEAKKNLPESENQPCITGKEPSCQKLNNKQYPQMPPTTKGS